MRRELAWERRHLPQVGYINSSSSSNLSGYSGRNTNLTVIYIFAYFLTRTIKVYDRTVDPPVLAGVVGMDISFAALQQAVGGIESKQAVLSTIVDRSKAVCPDLSMTNCQLESLRKYGSNDEGDETAICSTCNSIIQQLKSPICENHASDLWSNRLNQGRNFEERTCCTVGAEPRLENTLTDDEIKNGVCAEGFVLSSSIGLIIGIIVAVVVVSIGSYLFIRSRRNRLSNNPYMSNSTNNTNTNTNTNFYNNNYSSGTTTGVEMYPNNNTSSANNNASNIAEVQAYPIASFGEDDVVVLPAPTAPVVAQPVRY